MPSSTPPVRIECQQLTLQRQLFRDRLHMHKIIALLSLFVIFKGAFASASVTQFDGEYSYTDGPPSECIITGADVQNAGFRISMGVYFGIELSCRLSNPVNVRGMTAVLFDFQCSGEGMEWEERVLLQRLNDGRLLMAYEDWATIYHPCP